MHERDLFNDALEIADPAARRAHLDAACGGDQVLRVRMDRLLNRSLEVNDFLERPAADLCSDSVPEACPYSYEHIQVKTDHQTMAGGEDDTGQTVLANPAVVVSSPEPDEPPVLTGTSDAKVLPLGIMFGRYRIERVLGIGGMGVVYQAEDMRLGRRVALKIPKFDADGKLQLIQRFRREARTMASVLHRNLCPIFDVDEQNGTHFLTMAFIDGEPLSQVIKQMESQGTSQRNRDDSAQTFTTSATLDSTNRSFTARQIAELIRKLALALDAAHRAGVVHRDLKPANVMLDRSGEPILMDFGLAWMAHETDARVTQTGAIIGTPAYMSPEQADGESDKIGAASDIYSLGVILYELLTGRPIHTGNVTQVLYKLTNNTPLRPREIRSTVDPVLEAICLKAISRRPEDRFATAGEFAEAINNFLEIRTTDTADTIAVAMQADRASGRIIIADTTDALLQGTTIIPVTLQGTSRSKFLFVLLSLLLVGVLGAVWSLMADRARPHDEEIVQAPLPSPTTTNDRAVTDVPAMAIAPSSASQAKARQADWARNLGVPVEYTNSIGMKFVLIPPGEFLMGSTPAEIEKHLKELEKIEVSVQWQDRLQSEAPQHKVVLTRPIYLGVHEVTQKEYEAIVGTNPAHFSRFGAGKEAVANLDTRNHPVENVNWNQAVEFCAKLNETEKTQPFSFRFGEVVIPLSGKGYGLPTEALWEFACRAGSTTNFWIGDTDADLSRVGWFDSSSGGRTHEVGKFPANSFGLHDLHGNVWEWVEDAWEPKFYEQFFKTPAINPIASISDFPTRMIRGGSWGDRAWFCRSACRHTIDPLECFRGLGFRVSLTVDTVKTAIAKRTPPPGATPHPMIAPFEAEQAKVHQEAWAEHLGVPVEYTNVLGMKFVLIPPGEFTMGSSAADIQAALAFAGQDDHWQGVFKSEAPQHKVIRTRAIYLGVHEVTQEQYAQVMGQNPSQFSSTGVSKDAVSGLDTSRHPVEMVSWHDAAEFCEKLSVREKLKRFSPTGTRKAADFGLAPFRQPFEMLGWHDATRFSTKLSVLTHLNRFYSRSDETVTIWDGTGYCLPTEAEWEFGARAGTTTNFPLGDTVQVLVQSGWFNKNSGNRTHPVGELRANPFGLCDMHGNVWEWVQDWWEMHYYGQFDLEPAVDPIGPRETSGQRVVLRGGNWNDFGIHCRVSGRHASVPSHRSNTIGFRVALTVDAVKATIPERKP